MELIEFAERRGEEAAKFSLATLEVARARAHNMLSMLLGGAGAVVVLALSQNGDRTGFQLLAASVALWWFGLAVRLAVRGLRTNPVRTWAGEGARILRKGAQWQKYAQDLLAEGGQPVDPLLLLRQQELELMAEAAEEYRAASTQCAAVLDCTYVYAAFTPAPMVVAGLLYRFFG